MKVLLAVDNTEAAHHATQRAKALFPDAEYVILGVAELPPFVFGVALGGVASVSSDTHTSAIEENAASNVAVAAAQFPAEDAALDVETGDAGLVICREAARLGADVVVVGREDKSVLSRLFHPSVSDYVMKNASCPVLVVRIGDGRPTAAAGPGPANDERASAV